MLKPVSFFLARVLPHADAFMLRLTHGKRTITQIAGLPVIQLISTGAKTGQPRLSPLVGVIDGEKIALIASNFGQKHNPGWYYNLKANPQCFVQFNGRSGMYRAREAAGDEREAYWQTAVSYYKGYEAYRRRAAPRRIPVIVLEKVE